MTVQQDIGQQYYAGFSLHKFQETKTFKKFNQCLEDIHHNKLKDGFVLKEKYHSTADLRPFAYKYDESIIDVLFESKVPDIFKRLLGHNMFLMLVQIRQSYYQKEKRPYMPWHRDTYFYERTGMVGKVPPIYKIIYYPKFSEAQKNPCLSLCVGSHMKIFPNSNDDYKQINKDNIVSVFNSKKDFVLFNTAAFHHTVPPEDKNGQLRIIYSFCHEHQLKEDPDHSELHEIYKKKLENHESLYK